MKLNIIKLISILGCIWILYHSQNLYVYAYHLFSYPFEWEPTDGDHFNFIMRIVAGKNIFVDRSAGWMLSIYNPLFHYLAAFFGYILQSDNYLMLARRMSIIFTFSSSLIFFLYNWRKTADGVALVILFSLIMLFPSVEFYLLDLLNVSPNSLLVFVYLAGMLTIERVMSKNTNGFRSSLLLSIICIIVYLSKQQGILIFAVFGLAILFLDAKAIIKIKHLLILLSLIMAATICLEFAHNGIFLKSTLLDVGKMIFSDRDLALKRLLLFLRNNKYFILFATAYAIFCFKNRKLDIWVVAFLIHLPFLFKILGNAGGGNNYFGTFWVTLVVLNYKFVRIMVERKWFLFSGIALIMIFINLSRGFILLNQSLDLIQPPSTTNKEAYSQHMNSLREALLGAPRQPIILANRNIGSLVQAGLDIDIEGSTTFAYLWGIEHSNAILENIGNRKYDLIFEGIAKYPKDVQSAIEKNYVVSKITNFNLYFSKPGNFLIYVPKDRK